MSPPPARNHPPAPAAGVPDAPGAADARHHQDADRGRPDGALLDGGVGPSEDHGTDVEGLYAIGEASSGLHGANPQAETLIELLVYGRIVGEAAAAYAAGRMSRQRSAAALAAARAEVDQLLGNAGEENVRALQRAVRDIMTEHAGVVRDEVSCAQGLSWR